MADLCGDHQTHTELGSRENVKNSSKTNGVNGLELIQINKKMRLLPLNL